MADVKVRDFPDLVKRSGGVINTNKDDYRRAKSRIKQQNRIDRLELDMGEVQRKLDLLLSMMVRKNESEPG